MSFDLAARNTKRQVLNHSEWRAIRVCICTFGDIFGALDKRKLYFIGTMPECEFYPESSAAI